MAESCEHLWPAIREAEAKESRVQGQPVLQSNFKPDLVIYLDLVSK